MVESKSIGLKEESEVLADASVDIRNLKNGETIEVKTFTRIKRFFVSRFNTYKVIDDTIITPLNKKIEEFKNVELSNMKG